LAWCSWPTGRRDRRQGPDRSACDCRQVDGGIIAHGGDGFQGHVAGALDCPLIVLLEQDCADERRSLATALLRARFASGFATAELHHYRGPDPILLLMPPAHPLLP
jgi:hypothetical protein